MQAPSESESAPVLDGETRRRLLLWLWRWAGKLALLFFSLWLMALVLRWVVLRWIGEANPLTAFLLYLPPSVWYLPGVVLGLPALVLRWRAASLLMAAGFAIGVGEFGLPFRSSPAPIPVHSRRPDHLVVLTNNRGQHAGHSLRPFKNWIEPDVMVFQESSARASSYLQDPGYAEMTHGQSVGEFTVLSRYPVAPGELLTLAGEAGGAPLPYAARFELDWHGRKVAVYAVHLPSPRGPLLAMRGGAFLYGLPLPWEEWRKRGAAVGAFWRQHLRMAEVLGERLAQEALPCLVVGDFNAPDLGRVHRLLSRRLQDAHEEAGQGTGFTFPGATRNPLSLGGPWLRLDYIFCDRPSWQVEECWTEQDRPSQHRAVAARLGWKGDR